ncbi:MAG: hypothetical protein K0B06_11960 [Brevefilum sp.]|nr:hypothetical protein [Brevefilum sp.]
MDKYLEHVNQLIPIHQQVAGFNPALNQLYPVVVVEDEGMLIYDCLDDLGCYQFIKRIPAPMPIPKGVRAAFQLEDYGGRIACVVTPDVFDTPEGYVTILHEFVHCYQYETCEQDLKAKLDIAQQAQENGDVMWEIQHPFPYQAGAFTRAYTRFFAAIDIGDQPGLQMAREELYDYLGLHDFEYLVWQEWKEGFARWVENCIQQQLGIEENYGGLKPPYSRVSFYTSGAAYIDYLQTHEPHLVNDLRLLFTRMAEPLAVN